MTIIRHALPKTNYEQPDRGSVEKLLEFVQRRHPELAEVTVDQLNLSMWAVGHMFRLSEPTAKVSPSLFLDHAQQMVREQGWPSITGTAFFAAVLASGDVPYRAQDRGLGEISELGLDRHSGRPCSTPNVWRSIVAGHASLLPPVPPRGDRVRTALGNRARVYDKATGRELTSKDRLWASSNT